MTDKNKRGFAGMNKERQRQIASMGGKAAHAQGKAHEWDSTEAAAAGRRSHELGVAHQFTSREARAAGRKGGEATRKRNEKNETER